MDKPISIIKRDFEVNISNLINTCGLPTIIIEPVLADVLREIHSINVRQLEQDLAVWEEQQKGGEKTEC